LPANTRDARSCTLSTHRRCGSDGSNLEAMRRSSAT
jgi:hypothetical protein